MVNHSKMSKYGVGTNNLCISNKGFLSWQKILFDAFGYYYQLNFLGLSSEMGLEIAIHCISQFFLVMLDTCWDRFCQLFSKCWTRSFSYVKVTMSKCQLVRHVMLTRQFQRRLFANDSTRQRHQSFTYAQFHMYKQCLNIIHHPYDWQMDHQLAEARP